MAQTSSNVDIGVARHPDTPDVITARCIHCDRLLLEGRIRMFSEIGDFISEAR
jgi:hypothetical protein